MIDVILRRYMSLLDYPVVISEEAGMLLEHFRGTEVVVLVLVLVLPLEIARAHAHADS
jgi:hypothetical protein